MTRPSDPDLLQILKSAKNIAVVGASPNESRPSHWISKFLVAQGYVVFPVNPGHEQLMGVPCYPDVASVPEPIDIVNIFRRSDQVLPIVESTLQKGGAQLIWMQDNVYNEAAAELAESRGLPVVMNDCIYRFLKSY